MNMFSKPKHEFIVPKEGRASGSDRSSRAGKPELESAFADRTNKYGEWQLPLARQGYIVGPISG